MTTLDARHGAWVKALSQLLGSRAASLSFCVRIVKAAMEAGILPRDLFALQALVANTDKSSSEEPGPLPVGKGRSQGVPASLRARPSSAASRPPRALRRRSEWAAAALASPPFRSGLALQGV